MNHTVDVGLLLGPELADLADVVGVPASVRKPGEVAGRTAVRVRDLCRDGPGTLLVVDVAIPLEVHEAGPSGEFCLVSDHLNLTGENPLVGPNDPAWGPRFPDLTDAWSPELRATMRGAARAEGLTLGEGVVAGIRGLSPTAAERRMYWSLGAELASDGFVAEAITGRHAGRSMAGLAVLLRANRRPSDEAVGRLVRALVAGLGEVR